MDNNLAAINNMFADIPSEAGKGSEPATDKQDVTPKEEPQKSEPSVDKDVSSETGKKEPDTSAGKESTDFHDHPRFQELIKKKNYFRDSDKAKAETITKLEEELRQLKSRKVSDEELEGKSPTEVRKILEEQLKSEQEYEKLVSKRESEAADRYIEETLQDLEDAWHKFDKNELLKLSADYTEWDIEKAFELYQKLNQNTAKGADDEKKRQAKQKQSEANTSNRSQNNSSGGFVRWMSWWDLRSQMK